MADIEMPFWSIHAGYKADSLFLKGGCIAIGWPEVGNLKALPDDLEAFKARVAQAFPAEKPFMIPNHAGWLYRFVYELKPGHFVVYPSEIDKLIHLGRIEGYYDYQEADGPAYPHRRPVKWLKAVPRTEFPQRLLDEIRWTPGPFPVRRHAENFRAALEGREYVPGVSDDEWRLIRLFRCMTIPERHDVLVSVGQTLMRRYSVDPHLGRFSPAEETMKEELSPENVEDFDGRLIEAWPATWPGQLWLDLDMTDDARDFLHEALYHEVSYRVLGTADFDEHTADSLAESFLEHPLVVSEGVLPTEFGATQEEMRADLEADFVGFLRAWRERVVATIERQSRSHEGAPWSQQSGVEGDGVRAGDR